MNQQQYQGRTSQEHAADLDALWTCARAALAILLAVGVGHAAGSWLGWW